MSSGYLCARKKKPPRRLTFPSLYLFRTYTSLRWNKLELFCHSSVEEEWNRLKNHSGVKNCWTSLLHQTICWNPPLLGCRDCLQIAQDKKKSLSSISADLQFSAFRLLPLCLPPTSPTPTSLSSFSLAPVHSFFSSLGLSSVLSRKKSLQATVRAPIRMMNSVKSTSPSLLESKSFITFSTPSLSLEFCQWGERARECGHCVWYFHFCSLFKAVSQICSRP